MNTINNNDINELSYNTLETKRIDDIINDMNFDDDIKKNLCKEIIIGIEKSAYTNYINGKCAQLPFFGSIRKKYVINKMMSIRKRLKAIRSYVNKSEFKEYLKDIIAEFKEEEKEFDAKKLYLKKIKVANKKKYKKLVERIGIAYANMYIFSIYCFKEVPYNEEFEERYRELRDNDKNDTL